MAREFYQILEISEKATQEEIKKAYRKLALKWHPDRFATKTLKEKEEANKKMQEINKAYEILGNEELRKRYDLGMTDFAFEASEFSFGYEEGLENIRDELEKAKEEEKILAQKEVINIVGFEMLINEIYPPQLDSNLWVPCDKWQDKVWKIKIKSNPRGVMGIDTSELDKFKEVMIDAIRKRKEEWKAGINNPYFDKTKVNAIEVIEEVMKEKGLKAEDLGEYSNYKEQINILDRQWKIRNLRDKIVVYVRSGVGGKESEKSEKDLSFLGKFSDNQKYPEKKEGTKKQNWESLRRSEKDNGSGEYDNWDRKSLIKKIKELEEEIRELKQEKEDTPEFNAYFEKKGNELQESRQKLEELMSYDKERLKPKNISDNNFSTGLIVGGIAFGLLLTILVVNKNKKNK